jgi:hypothetical protein
LPELSEGLRIFGYFRLPGTGSGFFDHGNTLDVAAAQFPATLSGGGKFMLVLTRRLGQGLVIGNDIRVVVVGIKGKTVRLGVAAPTSIG